MFLLVLFAKAHTAPILISVFITGLIPQIMQLFEERWLFLLSPITWFLQVNDKMGKKKKKIHRIKLKSYHGSSNIKHNSSSMHSSVIVFICLTIVVIKIFEGLNARCQWRSVYLLDKADLQLHFLSISPTLQKLVWYNFQSD